MSSILSSHAELISALTELYTLLSTSGAVASDLVLLPDPATGLHPADKIASSAALSAGLSQEVVELLRALPYLDVNKNEMLLQLLPSTYPITYYGDHMDEGYFEGWRDILYEEIMPPSALKLTHNELHGFEFIYDVETKLVTPWNPMDTPGDNNNYYNVPGKPPREAFGEMIEKYRSLEYLGTPEGVDFNFFVESNGSSPERYTEGKSKKWLAEYDVWAATRKIRDICLDCGWDVNASEQKVFRRDEFMHRRNAHWEKVVTPLIERQDQL